MILKLKAFVTLLHCNLQYAAKLELGQDPAF